MNLLALLTVVGIQNCKANGGVPPGVWASFWKKIKILVLLFLIFCFPFWLAGLIASNARGQTTQQTFRDASGRSVGRSVSDTHGRTNYYDSMGRTTGRSVTSNSGTTFYDAMGRNTGSMRR